MDGSGPVQNANIAHREAVGVRLAGESLSLVIAPPEVQKLCPVCRLRSTLHDVFNGDPPRQAPGSARRIGSVALRLAFIDGLLVLSAKMLGVNPLDLASVAAQAFGGCQGHDVL